METQKVAEDSQNKENRNDSREFVVLQTQLAFFLGFLSKKVISFVCVIQEYNPYPMMSWSYAKMTSLFKLQSVLLLHA